MEPLSSIISSIPPSLWSSSLLFNLGKLYSSDWNKKNTDAQLIEFVAGELF